MEHFFDLVFDILVNVLLHLPLHFKNRLRLCQLKIVVNIQRWYENKLWSDKDEFSETNSVQKKLGPTYIQ